MMTLHNHRFTPAVHVEDSVDEAAEITTDDHDSAIDSTAQCQSHEDCMWSNEYGLDLALSVTLCCDKEHQILDGHMQILEESDANSSTQDERYNNIIGTMHDKP